MSEKPLIDKSLHIICWIVIALLLPFLIILYYTATNDFWIKIGKVTYEITYPIYFVVLAFLVIVFPHIVLFIREKSRLDSKGNQLVVLDLRRKTEA